MATDAEQLATIKSQILAVLVEITASPKPTYDLDGQNVLWGEYFDILTKKLADIDELINAGTPYEIHHQGFT